MRHFAAVFTSTWAFLAAWACYNDEPTTGAVFAANALAFAVLYHGADR